VYEEYKKNLLLVNSNLNSRPIPIIALQTFRKLWQQLTPVIKFLNHASDLCDTCYGFDTKLMSTKVKMKLQTLILNMKSIKKLQCVKENIITILLQKVKLIFQ